MTRGRTCGRLVWMLVAVLTASPPGTAGGFTDSDARTFELQRDLRTLRARVERAPRAASFDLRNCQRRVRAQRTEDPRDSRLQELALELDQLRAKADRAARNSATASPRRTAAQLDTPGYSDTGRNARQGARRRARTSASAWSRCSEALPR